LAEVFMQLVCWLRQCLGLVVAVLLLGSVAPASAMTLLDLNEGTSFLSGDGNLEFSFDAGSVALGGALNADLSNYSVITRDDGFRIVGPIAVADGNMGDIVLDYNVSSTRGMANPIVSAEVFFNGSVSAAGSPGGLMASAKVVQDFSNGSSLGVGATGGGFWDKSDSVDFAPIDSLDVSLRDIEVKSLEVGQLAAISVIDQRFNVVPEPGTAMLMLSGGLTGLAVMGVSRRRA
jgi:hypothetical protein